MWFELGGQCISVAGTSGTPTIPSGAVLLNVQALPASGGGTIVMPDGKGSTVTITLPDASNGFDYKPFHTNRKTTAANQLVFTGTSTYFVEYMLPSGVSVVS
jgi:hypothetical protein